VYENWILPLVYCPRWTINECIYCKNAHAHAATHSLYCLRPGYRTVALESSNRPLFPQWSHHVYPQFLPGTHPNHQNTPQVVIQQQHHQHFHQMQQQQQQQHHHMSSNANNNYINASMMNVVNNTANISPILHNNHIINNNHQHMHPTSMGINFANSAVGGGAGGGQMLSNDMQGAAYYQQQHQFLHQQQQQQQQQMNSTMPPLVGHATNGLAQHMKTRNRLLKNNGLNNNFYRSSGTESTTSSSSSSHLFSLPECDVDVVVVDFFHCFIAFSRIFSHSLLPPRNFLPQLFL
jgi:hypothetical protein